MAAWVLLAAGSPVHATVTVTPPSPYAITSSGVIYYAGHDTSTSPTLGFVDTGAGFKFLDLDGTSSENDLLLFDVTSSKSFGNLTSGQSVVVTATVSLNGSTPTAVPIAYAGSGFCSASGNSRCQARSGSYYYAATYSVSSGNETLRVGLFPKEICSAPYVAGTISGCATGTGLLENPTATAVKSLVLRFYVSLQEPSGIGKIADSEDNKTVTLQFQLGAPSLTCPTLAELGNAYAPGDGRISFNGAAITTSYSSATLVGSPVDSLVVLASEGTLTTTNFFNDSSQIIARISSTSTTDITGFANTTDGSNHLYRLGIGARDRAGVVGSSFCTQAPATTTDYQVQTSSIRGLMVQNQCFIATAAFGTADGPALELLRALRDRILLPGAPGRAFVRLYYRVSPGMADWLLAHPELRTWVLERLFVVQVWAWMLLHPLVTLVTLAGVVAGLYWLGWIRRRGLQASGVIGLLLVAAWIPLLQMTAHAEEEPDLSFIEEIQARQRQETPQPGAGKSLIETEKAKLGPPEDYSLIEEIREEQGVIAPVPTGALKPASSGTQAKSEGGAIQAVREGRSELKAVKEEKSGSAFGIKVWASGTRSITAPATVFYRSFDSFYGTDYTPDFRFFYEGQLLQSEWFLSLGWFAELGFGFKSANGNFEFAPQKPDGTNFDSTSGVRFTFVTIPAAVGAVARFNLFRVLRPQIKAAPVVVGYFEDRSDSNGLKRGNSRGLLTEAGLAVQLDWLDSRGSWSMYEMFRVKHHFITLDYQRLDTLQGDVDFSFHGLSLGLLFEI